MHNTVYTPLLRAGLAPDRVGKPVPPKIHLSFTPRWFARRMELDYGPAWHTDPIYRQKSFVRMAEKLNREFPSLKPGGDTTRIIGGISQIGSCTPMAALFGQRVEYGADRWPDNKGRTLTDEETDALEVADILDHPFYLDLVRQMEIIKREWGVVEGELNLQGILNTAFRIRGQDVFADMYLNPTRVHHLLDVVCQTTILFNNELARLQAEYGCVKRHFVTSNCVGNMISERHYRAFVMPYDRKLHDHYTFFGIHNCGWNVDAYAKAYSEIGNILYLDFGFDSDLTALASCSPARCSRSFTTLRTCSA